MSIQVYTLWASLKNTEPTPWMIAAEDEYAWEGDPERCEKGFAAARDLAEKNNWDVREIIIEVAGGRIAEAFEAKKIRAVSVKAAQ